MRATGRYLLDTSIVIPILRKEPSATSALTGAEELFISAVVLGELYYGAYRSTNSEQNLQEIKRFTENCIVLEVNNSVAESYGLLKDYLRRRGKPIPENDIWVAATALLYELPLVARDAHFLEVPELRLVEW